MDAKLKTDDILQRLPDPIMTDRLVLRAPQRQDADDLARLANNRNIHRWLARLPHPYTVEHALDFIENLARTETEHAYAITREEALVGVMGFHRVSHGGREVLELGYWLGEPYWGKGYATEAGAALVGAALDITPNAPLFARAIADNAASRKILTRLGFIETDERTEGCGQHANVPVVHFTFKGEAQ